MLSVQIEIDKKKSDDYSKILKILAMTLLRNDGSRRKRKARRKKYL
jgi:hypothetical protein